MEDLALNVLLLFWVAAAFGIAYVFIKLEETSFGPITEAAGRAIIAFVCLLIVSLILRKDLAGHVRDIWRFLVFGILSAVIVYLGLAFGEKYTAAGISSVMVSSVPLLTFVITVFILREQTFSISGMAGLIVGIFGLILVVGLENILDASSTLKGVVILLTGFFSFALNGILVPKIGKGIDPIITTTYLLGLAAIILWVLAFILEHPLNTPLTSDNILFELGLGVISTASAVLGYYYLIKRAGPLFASISFYMVPVFGVVFSFLILREQITASQVLGILIVLIGVFLINRETFKKTG